MYDFGSFKLAAGREKAFVSLLFGGHIYSSEYQNGVFSAPIRLDGDFGNINGILSFDHISFDLSVSRTDKALVVYTKNFADFARRTYLNKYDGTQWIGEQLLEPNYESAFPWVAISPDGKRAIVAHWRYFPYSSEPKQLYVNGY